MFYYYYYIHPRVRPSVGLRITM